MIRALRSCCTPSPERSAVPLYLVNLPRMWDSVTGVACLIEGKLERCNNVLKPEGLASHP